MVANAATPIGSARRRKYERRLDIVSAIVVFGAQCRLAGGKDHISRKVLSRFQEWT
jgi:hypothetical protein